MHSFSFESSDTDIGREWFYASPARTCTCKRMATKTLTITEEAYERLKAHKRENESFTDTVLRLTDADRDVMRGFGMLADDEGFTEVAGRTRRDLDEAFEKRRKRREPLSNDRDSA